jgi:F-type H+-transporting ATPase subunit b
MLEVNGTLIVLVLSFLVFMWALNLVYVKPVAKAMEARNARIEQDLAASRTLQEDAQAVLAQYEKHLAEVRTKSQDIINEAVTAAQKTRNDAMSKVQGEGRARIDAARIELAREKQDLVGNLVESEMQIVSTILQKLIGDSSTAGLDRARVQRAIEEAC